MPSSLGKLSNRKNGETWELVQSGDDNPSPLPSGVGTLFELGTCLKRNDHLQILRNKLNMKILGTKSIDMSEIMVYLAMLSTTNLICLGPNKMKMSH